MSGTHGGKTVRTVQKVQLTPLWWAAAGVAGLAVIDRVGMLSVAGWCAGLLYLCGSNALLARGLRRHRTARFGPANAITAMRSTLVGLITALIATSFTEPVSVSLLIGLTVPALALDAVDGWIARRTHTISALGARFDMEVDAFLILALSAYVSQDLGWWVLTMGVLRYALGAAEWFIPALRVTAPPRYWRKVVAAIAGIALALAASDLAPSAVDYLVTAVALVLLLESFGRDILWMLRQSRPAVRPVVQMQFGVSPTDRA